MRDRLQEIAARLEAVNDTTPRGVQRMVWVSDREYVLEDDRDRDSQAFHQNAASDIAWLLRELALWQTAARNGLYGACWCDAPRSDCCYCPGSENNA